MVLSVLVGLLAALLTNSEGVVLSVLQECKLLLSGESGDLQSSWEPERLYPLITVWPTVVGCPTIIASPTIAEWPTMLSQSSMLSLSKFVSVLLFSVKVLLLSKYGSFRMSDDEPLYPSSTKTICIQSLLPPERREAVEGKGGKMGEGRGGRERGGEGEGRGGRERGGEGGRGEEKGSEGGGRERGERHTELHD